MVSNSENPVDLKEVQRMIGDSLDLFSSLVEVFTEESVFQFAAIIKSVDNLDAVALDLAAHSFKSSLATLGAFKASKIAEKLEAMGKTGNIDGSVELSKKLTSEYEKVFSYFESRQWRKDWDLIN